MSQGAPGRHRRRHDGCQARPHRSCRGPRRGRGAPEAEGPCQGRGAGRPGGRRRGDRRCGERRVAALVHLRSETDFSAKAADFLACTQEIAEAVRDDGTEAVGAFDQHRRAAALQEGEHLPRSGGAGARRRGQQARRLPTPPGRPGVNGVIVEGEGVDAEVLHQVALHVAFASLAIWTAARCPTPTWNVSAPRCWRSPRPRGARGGLGQDRSGPPHRMVPRERPAGAGPAR